MKIKQLILSALLFPGTSQPVPAMMDTDTDTDRYAAAYAHQEKLSTIDSGTGINIAVVHAMYPLLAANHVYHISKFCKGCRQEGANCCHEDTFMQALALSNKDKDSATLPVTALANALFPYEEITSKQTIQTLALLYDYHQALQQEFTLIPPNISDSFGISSNITISSPVCSDNDSSEDSPPLCLGSRNGSEKKYTQQAYTLYQEIQNTFKQTDKNTTSLAANSSHTKCEQLTAAFTKNIRMKKDHDLIFFEHKDVWQPYATVSLRRLVDNRTDNSSTEMSAILNSLNDICWNDRDIETTLSPILEQVLSSLKDYFTWELGDNSPHQGADKDQRFKKLNVWVKQRYPLLDTKKNKKLLEKLQEELSLDTTEKASALLLKAINYYWHKTTQTSDKDDDMHKKTTTALKTIVRHIKSSSHQFRITGFLFFDFPHQQQL